MTKYVVLEIIDREVGYIIYETFEEAVEALREAYEEIVERYDLDKENDFQCGIDENGTTAYVNYSWLYDWQIITV